MKVRFFRRKKSHHSPRWCGLWKTDITSSGVMYSWSWKYVFWFFLTHFALLTFTRITEWITESDFTYKLPVCIVKTVQTQSDIIKILRGTFFMDAFVKSGLW